MCYGTRNSVITITRQTSKFTAIALVVCLLVPAGAAIAKEDNRSESTDEPAVNPTVDSIERKIETDSHERLLRLIAAPETTLSDFTTDGCSGGQSSTWQYLAEQMPDIEARLGERPPWEECCVVHDVAYHEGGAKSTTAVESFDQRKSADLELMACVVATGQQRSAELGDEYGLSDEQVTLLYKSISELMYRAIRIGGAPCTEQPWRWGYGWPKCP